MHPLIGPDEVRAWHEHGFLDIRRQVVSAADLNELLALLAPLVTGWSALPAGYAQDLGSGDACSPTLPEVIYASRLRPRLVRTAGFVRLRSIASALFDGRPVSLHFDHIVAKPPGAPATAWHQDVAFDPTFDMPMAAVWLPFVDVDVSNGAMRFVPGSHLGEIAEHVPHGRHGRRAEGVDTASAITCALTAGAVCVHMPRTLHASTANSSDRDRLAWVVKFVPDDHSPVHRAIAARRARRRPVTVRDPAP